MCMIFFFFFKVYDLLIASKDQGSCLQAAKDLLQVLDQLGYKVSAKKAQICVSEVTCLGYILKESKRWLLPALKQTILDILAPKTQRQIWEFLGSARFCQLWIPGFAEVAKPLYEATHSTEESFLWIETQEGIFTATKEALLKAPTLSLSDINKPFQQFIDERVGVTKGVLTPWTLEATCGLFIQVIGSHGLWIITATALLVKDTDKLILEQPLTITTPNLIEGVLKNPPDWWMTNAQ